MVKSGGVRMRARLVVFPVRGRNWCFTTSIQPSISDSSSSHSPTTFKHLWSIISTSHHKSSTSKAEVLVDFAANKVLCSFLLLKFFYGLVYIYLKLWSFYFFVLLGRWIKVGRVWRRRPRDLSRIRFMGKLKRVFL